MSAARRLHFVLTEGHRRILTALTRQRLLLLSFCLKNPCPDAEGSLLYPKDLESMSAKNRSADRPTGTAWHAGQSCGRRTSAADGDKEHEWKRHTLHRMRQLLRRKMLVEMHAAMPADLDTLHRDIEKIDLELQRLARSPTNTATTSAAATRPKRSLTTTRADQLSPTSYDMSVEMRVRSNDDKPVTKNAGSVDTSLGMSPRAPEVADVPLSGRVPKVGRKTGGRCDHTMVECSTHQQQY